MCPPELSGLSVLEPIDGCLIAVTIAPLGALPRAKCVRVCFEFVRNASAFAYANTRMCTIALFITVAEVHSRGLLFTTLLATRLLINTDTWGERII